MTDRPITTTYIQTPTGHYRYNLRSTGHSSAKFGPCGVCGNHCPEVYHQWEEKEYTPDQAELDHIKELDIEVTEFWSQYQCGNLFGHQECLEKQRQEATDTCKCDCGQFTE